MTGLTIFNLVFAVILFKTSFLGIGQHYKIKSGKAKEYKPDSILRWSDTTSDWDFRTQVENGFWGCKEVPGLMFLYCIGIFLAWFVFFLLIFYSN